MATFKLAIGDPKTKKTFKAELSGGDAENLIGRRIGDKFRGELIGLSGYELEITGGSDNSGFPMWKSLEGQGRKKIILTDGFGFKAKIKGQRKRRSIAGNTISTQTAQVNCKVIKIGKDSITKILGVEEAHKESKAKPEEKLSEAPKEEAKEELKQKDTAEQNTTETSAKAEVKKEESKLENKINKEDKKEE